jgi:hypothetical protein
MADRPTTDPKRAEHEPSHSQPEHENISPVLGADPRIPHAVTDEYRANNARKDHRERRKLWIEFATLLAVVIYAAAAFWQGCEMRKAAVAAKKSADTAQESNRITRNALELGQRPWLAFGGSPTINKRGKNIWYIDFEIQNFGHSPALHSSPNTNLVFAPFSGDLSALISVTCSRGENVTLGTIGKRPPNVPREETGYTVFPGVPIQLKQTVGDAKTAVTFYGCLTYLDQFADPGDRKAIHHTPYCYNAREPLFVGERMEPCFTVNPPD